MILLKTLIYPIAFLLPPSNSGVLSRPPRGDYENLLRWRRLAFVHHRGGSMLADSIASSRFQSRFHPSRLILKWFVLQVLRQVEGLDAFVQTINIMLESRFHKNVVVARLLIFELPGDLRHFADFIPFWNIVSMFIGRRIHEMFDVAKKGARLIENTFQLLWNRVVVVLVVGFQLILVEQRERCNVNLRVLVPLMRNAL